MPFLYFSAPSGKTAIRRDVMKTFLIWLALAAVLLSGCVSTAEGLQRHPAKPEKLLTQYR